MAQTLAKVAIDARTSKNYTSPTDVLFAGLIRNMAIQTDEQQQTQLELEGLRRTLQWTEIQQEQLLDRLDLLRLENARLQDRVEELVRQVEGLKQQQPLF